MENTRGNLKNLFVYLFIIYYLYIIKDLIFLNIYHRLRNVSLLIVEFVLSY